MSPWPFMSKSINFVAVLSLNVNVWIGLKRRTCSKDNTYSFVSITTLFDKQNVYFVNDTCFELLKNRLSNILGYFEGKYCVWIINCDAG